MKLIQEKSLLHVKLVTKGLLLNVNYFDIMKLKLKEKLFSFEVCLKNYSSKRGLNDHMKIHDESKAFKCDVLWQVFDKNPV